MDELIKKIRGAQTSESIKTHSFSPHKLRDYPQLAENLLKVKSACALANKEAKVIPEQKADEIILICANLIEKKDYSFLENDPLQGGGGVGLNYAINEFILDESSNLAFEEVNASQSSSDVVFTAMALTFRFYIDKLYLTIQKTISDLEIKARAWKDIQIPARTCLQLASSAPLGSIFKSFALSMQRSLDQLKIYEVMLTKVNLGGTVFGSCEGASQEYLTAVRETLPLILGKKIEWRDNLFDSAQNMDQIVRFSGELATLAGTLINLAQDIRLMSMEPENSLGILDIPYTIKGSSFFKNKKNPTLPETLIQCAFMIKGQTHSISLAADHGELQLNIYTPFSAMLLIEQMALLEKSLKNFTQFCLIDIKPYAEKYSQKGSL